MTEAAIITGEVRKIAATRLAEANQDWRLGLLLGASTGAGGSSLPVSEALVLQQKDEELESLRQQLHDVQSMYEQARADAQQERDQKPLPGMGDSGLSRAVRAFPCRKLIDNPAAPFVDCEFCLGLRKHTSPSLIPSPEIQEDDYDKHSRLEAAISDQMDVIQQLTTEKSKMQAELTAAMKVIRQRDRENSTMAFQIKQLLAQQNKLKMSMTS